MTYKCKSCSKSFKSETPVCPHCGSTEVARRKSPLPWIIVGVFVLFVCGFLGLVAVSMPDAETPEVALATSVPTLVVTPVPTLIPTKDVVTEYLWAQKQANTLFIYADDMLAFSQLGSEIDGDNWATMFDESWQKRVTKELNDMVTHSKMLADNDSPGGSRSDLDFVFDEMYNETVQFSEDFKDGVENMDSVSLDKALVHLNRINSLISEGVTLTQGEK